MESKTQEEIDAAAIRDMHDIDLRVSAVHDAILDGYSWKVIQTGNGYRWELNRLPIMIAIEISWMEVHRYKYGYSKLHPEWQYTEFGLPKPLEEIASPWGRLTGYSGYSGVAWYAGPRVQSEPASYMKYAVSTKSKI